MWRSAQSQGTQFALISSFPRGRHKHIIDFLSVHTSIDDGNRKLKWPGKLLPKVPVDRLHRGILFKRIATEFSAYGSCEPNVRQIESC